MPDLLLITTGGIFIVVGIIGWIVPVIPGPPISYVGLLLLQFSSKHPFTVTFLIIFGVLTMLVTILDYIIPVLGIKKLRGSKYGIWGSIIGLMAGLIFFPPLGIIIGPFLGALAGEIISGKKSHEAIKPALGTFIGFLLGTAIKLSLTLIMAYNFVIEII